MRRPLAALGAVALASVLLAGCTGSTPPSPVAAIPKLLIDYEENTTRIYLTSINADVKYGNLSVSLANENLTANITFNETRTFALVGGTNLTYFVLNATADEGTTHYFYNASVHIADRTPADPNDPLVYQAYIRETPDGPIRPEALPYRHVLAAG